MSLHIAASPGDLAPFVLLPGDPLRAQHAARTYLDGATCVNEVRGMLGFTGTWRGRPVSIQGTGMGVPSLAIYVTELIREHGARTLIRVGTCGGLQPDLRLGDLVLAQSACSDSRMNQLKFGGRDFAPTASFDLLLAAWQAASARGLTPRVGPVYTTDTFYQDEPAPWDIWRDHGVLAVEMESAALYTLSAAHRVQALSILTVSDEIYTHARASAEQRQKAFMAMVEIALELAVPGA
jgi:purine-nucleoside phosphorylase